MKLHIETDYSAADAHIIDAALSRYNQTQLPGYGSEPLAVFLRDNDGTIHGGLIARTGRGWLHIRTLWVDDQLRGQGMGAQLLATAEAEGLRRGCHSAYLNTFSFQARPFYEKCGYEVFGVLDDFPAGQQRFFYAQSARQQIKRIINC